MLQIGGKFVKAKGFLGCGTPLFQLFGNSLPRSFYTAPAKFTSLEGARMHPTGVEWAWNQSLSPRSSLARKLIYTSAGVGILKAPKILAMRCVSAGRQPPKAGFSL